MPLLEGLRRLSSEIDEGTFEFRRELEDIHMNIEKALVDRIGPAGAKLHSARSRNDQIALDLKLYLRDQCDILTGCWLRYARPLSFWPGSIWAGSCRAIPICRRAQPVLISHHMLAYFEMFGRDLDASCGLPQTVESLTARLRRHGRYRPAHRPGAGGRDPWF